MGFWQRLAASVGIPGEPKRDPLDPRNWGLTPGYSIAGITVTPEAVAQLDVVQGTLERLAGSISTMPLQVFERIDDDERRPATGLPLYDILHRRPNARQTAQEFRDEQQRHLAFYRNAYALILSERDTPVSGLEAIHPSRVVKIDRAPDGRVYYTVRRLDGSGQDVFRDDVIWHLRKPPLTPDGLRGVPVYETARETFGRAIAVKQFGSLFFANGGSGGILKHPGTFKSTEEQDDFMKAWREAGSGPNRHKDRLLKYGVDYKPIEIKNNEAQFLETDREWDIRVARLWNMPPHMIGLLDRATHQNIEQESINYVAHTLAPWIGCWEQGASRDLLIGDEQRRFYVEFNVAGLLRGDLKAMFEAFARGRQWGWLSINDIRRMLNMNPIGPAGDVYLSPMNMVPAGEENGERDNGNGPSPAPA